MTFEVIAKTRSVQGSGASRRLRQSGYVPGVVYGAGQQPAIVEMEHNPLWHQLKLEAFHSSVLNLNVDGKVETVVLRNVQYHAFKQLVLHIDFLRVAADQKIHAKVPLHFKNAENCVAVKLGGGSISHIVNEVEVVCLPGSLPGFIEVDLENMVAGHTLHVTDLVLPAGVELAAVLRGENFGVATLVGAKGGAEEA